MNLKCYFFIVTLIVFIISSSYNFAQTANLEATLSLKKVDDIIVPYQNGFTLPSFEKQSRKLIDLRGEWKKLRFFADDNISLGKRDSIGYNNLITEASLRYSSSFDDSGWEIKVLPSVENQMNVYPTVPEYYQEGVWYRKSFNVDSADSGKFVKLNFYSVNYLADVWLNDIYLGYHEGGYTPFSFDVSSALNYGGKNVLAVRVDNPAWGGRNDIVPYTECDWFNYTGIIHDVYLEFSSPVSVIRNDIVPLTLNGSIQSTIILKNIKSKAEVIVITAEIFETSIDSGNIKTEFSYQLISGDAVGMAQSTFTIPSDSSGVWRTTVQIENPKLWTPKHPYLYIMKVTLKDGNNIIDEFCSQFGIRTVTTKGNKFLLNNKVVFLTGAARHEDHPVYGRSIPKDVIFSDLQLVKTNYINFLRTAHYPNNLYTYLIADRLGITTLEEIPVWWFDDANAWQIQNNERHIHEQMFREMIFKDYNRPSILMWSTSNECRDVHNRKTFIERVHQDLDSNYPDGRLVTQSAAADRPGPNDDSQNACDVPGWTMYFGIFHGSVYFTGTYNFINSAKTNFPNKPLMDTEFGYWSSENNSTEQKQIDVFNNTFLAFKQHAALNSAGNLNIDGSLMTCTWWCIFDWYSHGHPYGFQSMGLYSMDRMRAKPVSTVLKASYLPYYNFDGVITNISDENKSLPDIFKLLQSFPNPFNSVTKIRYRIPVSSSLPKSASENALITLEVFDILGNIVATLVNENKPSGLYEVDFDASGLSTGIYFCQLKYGNFISVIKLSLLK